MCSNRRRCSQPDGRLRRCVCVMKKAGAVLVLEGNQKLGRKLLATGNRRCNLTNLAAAPRTTSDTAAAAQLLHTIRRTWCAAFSAIWGFVTKPDGEGRVYPAAGRRPRCSRHCAAVPGKTVRSAGSARR